MTSPSERIFGAVDGARPRAQTRGARGQIRRGWKLLAICALGLNLAPAAAARMSARSVHLPSLDSFKYVGGTEKIHKGCVGQLGLTATAMIFSCPRGSVRIPYRSILIMQYRADISREVRRMKLAWRFRPWRSGGDHNRYFTVVYRASQKNHAMILAVSPAAMRPYLAEIDLTVGRRVEVQSHQKYY